VSPETAISTLVLIDGSGITFRAFYGLPPLSTPQGIPIGAVLGFCNILLKIQEDLNPSHWAVIFDTGQPTFRHTLFPEYKATRGAPPEDLKIQFPMIREACQALHIKDLDQPGMEADDLIASYARYAENHGWDVLIASSDKDMAQLVSPHIRLYDPFKQKILNEESIKELWGVAPSCTPDIQALAGDPSDNVPGIPGIGIKTATKWIQHFGSLEALLARPQELLNATKQALLEEYKDQVKLCRDLVLLNDQIPCAHSLEDFQLTPPLPSPLTSFLTQYSLQGLQQRLVRKGWLSHTQDTPPLQLEGSLQEALDKGSIAISLHMDSNGSVQGAGISYDLHKATYLSAQETYDLLSHTSCLKIFHDAKALLHKIGPHLSSTGQDHQTEPKQLIAPPLLPMGASPPSPKDAQNDHKVNLFPLDDIMLMSYVADGGHLSHDLNSIAQRILNRSLPEDPTSENFATRANIIFQCWTHLKKRILDTQSSFTYYTLDRPLIPVLYQMETRGIGLDVAYLTDLHHQFIKDLHQLEERIFLLAGKSFVIGSPKQLGDVLFKDLGWPPSKKGKSGAFQTSVDVLESFAAEGKELAILLLQWRQLSKLTTTYTESLAHQADPVTERVHTTYGMAITSTGRLSSINPNLQNIPIRTAEGKLIRKAFCTDPGNYLISLDYSQIELRLLAHMGNESHLQKAFQNGQDIHQQTACGLFSCTPDEVTDDMRRQAKIINFGLIYGMSAFGLSQQLNVSVPHAKSIISNYFSLYPDIAKYMDQCKEEAREKGYVSTLWGRRCYVPHILSSHYGLRSAAERQAINAPLQGTSADLMKRAMISMTQWIAESKAPFHLLLQVHDEVILEVPEPLVQEAISHLVPLMTSAASLTVPLEVNASWRHRWE